MDAAKRAEIKAFKKEKLNKRITELDALRGIAVFLMVFDHFMYDIFGVMPNMFPDAYKVGTFWRDFRDLAIKWWTWDVRIYVRLLVLFIFLSLTGVSCSFSRSNLKRGIKLLIFALLLTGATVLIDYVGEMGGGMIIVFGILHLIALCLIIIALLEKITQEKFVYLIIGVLMVFAGLIISKPIGLFEYYVQWDNFFPMFWDAFIGKSLLGPDSYSFFFFGGQVFIGVFLGKLLYPERKSLIFKKGYSNNPLTFTGRHTLIVYVAHQVLIPVILGIIMLISGYSLSM